MSVPKRAKALGTLYVKYDHSFRSKITSILMHSIFTSIKLFKSVLLIQFYCVKYLQVECNKRQLHFLFRFFYKIIVSITSMQASIM